MAKVGRMVKDQMVQELAQVLGERPNFFVTSIGKLEASETDGLRKKLRSVRSRFLVVKRTLGTRGLSLVKTEEAASLFAGSVGLILPSEDVLPTAKVIVEFAKSHEEQLVVRGGWVDGQLLAKQHVEHLASLPPKPQLIAELIGVLESPISDLIFTLERVLGDIPWVLEEASKTRPAQPQAQAAAETSAPARAPDAAPESSSHATEEPEGGSHG